MQMIEAVIIDLDDTLCMTEAVSFEMENKALEQLGSTLIPRDVHFRTWGKPLFEIIATRSPGVDVEAFKKTYRPIVEEFAKAGKFDDIPKENYEALDTLLRLDKVLIILTSRARAELHHLLSPDHLLASRVKTFYYRDNMQYHKPDPRAFDGLLQDSSLQPGQCIYVGDSTSDAQAAKAAGLHFVASLESGLRQREDFDGLQSMDLLGNSPTSWM
jgi:HAD superfamily hydrolase (TIGR01509 family)